MEEYRNIAQKFFVPSLFTVFFISATIILSYSIILNGYGQIAGIIFFILSALSLPFVYRNSMRVAPECGAHLPAARARVVCLMICTAALSIFLSVRIRDCGREKLPLPQAVYIGEVIRAVDRRYDQEVFLRFQRLERGGRGSPDGTAWLTGTAYISGGPCLHAGDRLEFYAKPVPVALLDSTSAFQRSLVCRGTGYLMYLEGDTVSVVRSEATLREQIRERLSAGCDALFRKDTASVVKALYFGNQSYIDKHILNDFKRAGVLHVLAASGLHVGIVAGTLLLLLGLCRLNRKWALAAAGLAIVLYLYITDLPVSLLRAGIMFMIYSLQRIIDREINTINTLFLSGIAILTIFPHEIYSLGFQLSFGATLGILLFHRLYRRVLTYLPSRISDTLALTISAQVLVIPVLLLQVGELNLSCVISNIIIVPAMSLLLIVSLAASGLSLVTAYAAYLGSVADAIFSLNKLVVGSLSGLMCHFNVSAVHPVLFAAFGMLLLPLFPWTSHKRVVSLSIAAAFGCAWLSLAIPQAADENPRVIEHDRGSALILRDGTAVSVIGALPGRKRLGLVEKEITKTPFRDISFYIPHPDYRNIAGYSYLAKRYPVRVCYLTETFPIGSYVKKFFRILDRDGVVLVMQNFDSCRAAGRTPSRVSGSAAFHDRVCVSYNSLLKRLRSKVSR
ncbi:MAG: hypothetical protein A2W19_12680 [Spirochaetes bacterium RBG_16_49_21]|nr:MAG: hypothetical protein A2W19_12680 [Spirochaetes bacterium RBG_16_49_21]